MGQISQQWRATFTGASSCCTDNSIAFILTLAPVKVFGEKNIWLTTCTAYPHRKPGRTSLIPTAQPLAVLMPIKFTAGPHYLCSQSTSYMWPSGKNRGQASSRCLCELIDRVWHLWPWRRGQAMCKQPTQLEHMVVDPQLTSLWHAARFVLSISWVFTRVSRDNTILKLNQTIQLQNLLLLCNQIHYSLLMPRVHLLYCSSRSVMQAA